jgi:hypothetical protein
MQDTVITTIIEETSKEFNIPKSTVILFIKYFFNWQYQAINTLQAVSYLWTGILTITLFNKKKDNKYFEAVDEYLLENRRSANKTPTKGWQTTKHKS